MDNDIDVISHFIWHINGILIILHFMKNRYLIIPRSISDIKLWHHRWDITRK